MAFDRLCKYARDVNSTTSFTCFMCSAKTSTSHGVAMAIHHSKTHPSSCRQALWCFLNTSRPFYEREEATEHMKKTKYIGLLPALNLASPVFAAAVNKVPNGYAPDEPPFPQSAIYLYAYF